MTIHDTPDVSTGPPPPLPRRHHRVLNTVTGVGALVVVLVAGGVAASSVSHPVSAPAPRTTTSAPAASRPSVAAVQRWLAGAGYQDLVTVQNDAENASADVDAGDVAAVESDGALLAADSRTAADNPPPVTGSVDYVSAMRQYATAGDEMAVDEFSAAVAHLDAGNTLLQRATNEIPSAA